MGEEGYSLSGRVFHTIRENILSGKYKCDEELKEKTLGDELGVSRTPVREALRQLELEGLVRIIPNRGAFVEGITKEDVKDIYEIRARLEGLCAKWAADRITKDQIAELEENIFLVEFHAKKENYAQILELDRVLKITLSMPDRVVKSNDEHKKIVEALKQHNAKEAELLATSHMLNTIENMDNYGWDNLLK